MKNLIFTLLAFAAVSFSFRAVATDSDAPVPYQWGVFKPVKNGTKDKVILEPWFTAEGQRRLARSHSKKDFYQLAHHYQPQLTPVYAGVASAVIVMNGVRLPTHAMKSQRESEIAKPPALGGGIIPFPAYNQVNFFNEATDAVKNRKELGLQNVTPSNQNDKSQFKPGTSLSELKGLLGVYQFTAVVQEASAEPKLGAPAFRKVLKSVLSENDHFLLANFKGDDLGASTEGTVSPLVAYDAQSDSVLVLDVTGHKNPWYWAPVDAFYRSMHTQYGAGTWRGWLTVSQTK